MVIQRPMLLLMLMLMRLKMQCLLYVCVSIQDYILARDGDRSFIITQP